MKTSIILVSVLISCVSVSNAANILAIFTIASPSHHIWNSPLVMALAKRGHNVTVLSQAGQNNPTPNLTDLVMENLYDAVTEEHNFLEMTDMSEFQTIPMSLAYTMKGCFHALDSNAFKQLMNYPSGTKFDLIIIESIGCECLLGLTHKFGKPPIVIINAFSVSTWLYEITGTPNIPSYFPHYLSAVTDHMTFIERLYNLILTTYTYYLYHYSYLPSIDKKAKMYFGPNIPSSLEMLKNVSLAMANFHPTLDYPLPMTPNLISVAGIQIEEPKPLPADLQTFLDDAEEGAIFFSLGSNVKSDQLPEEKRKAILAAFAVLPQRVLWKFESDMSGLPRNVKIEKWLPQNDILSHPNVKVFVTHAGLLSTHETVYRGVPVVGIPFMLDQHINIRRLVHHGVGILLEYRDLTKETLLQAIRAVIEKLSYRENMKALSARFRDDPQTPLERAVFWTEYVLHHKGASHMQSAAKDLNFIQYFLLDVIAFLVAIPILLITVLCCACCRRKSRQLRKHKRH